MLSIAPVRVLAFLMVLAGCQPALDEPDVDGYGGGSGSAQLGECHVDSDCETAGATCCACPTFAVPTSDPGQHACNEIACPASNCADNVRAACTNNACVLECIAMACSSSCDQGYALDANGCLSCDCDQVAAPTCAVDTDCVRVPADCCGCANGGVDTAVPAGDTDAYNAGLDCAPNPSCPGNDTCAPDLAPACVQGSCELVAPVPPAACGRTDLPPCPTGQNCTINASDAATAQG